MFMTHSHRGGETKNMFVEQSVFLNFRKGSQWKKKNVNKKRFMTNNIMGNINSSSSAKVHQA